MCEAEDYQDGRDEVSVSETSTKAVEINFQLTSHQPRQPRSSFSEPAIDSGGRDQISVNRLSTNVLEIKLSVNQISTETAEIKFQ